MKKNIISYISLALVLVISLIYIPQIVNAEGELQYVTDATYDFETFDSSLNNSNFVVKKYDDINNTTNALGITLTDAVNDGLRKIPIKIPLKNNENYELTFRYYAKAGTQIENLEFITVDDPVELEWNAPNVSQVKVFSNLELDVEKGTDGQWKTLTVPFTASTMKNTTECPYLALKVKKSTTTYGNFGFYIDDLSIKKVEIPETQLVDFSDSTTLTGSSGITRIGDTIGGNSGGCLRYTSGGTTTTYKGRIDGIKLSKGIYYQISFKMYSDKFDGSLTFGIQTNNVDSAYQKACEEYKTMAIEGLEATTGTNGKWINVSTKFQAKATDNDGALSIFFKSTEGNVIYIDDIEAEILSYQYMDFSDTKMTTGTSYIKQVSDTIGGNSGGCLRYTSNGTTTTYKGNLKNIKLQSGVPYEIAFKMYSDKFDGSLTFGVQTNMTASAWTNACTEYETTEIEGLEATTGTNGKWINVKIYITAKCTNNDGIVGLFFKSTKENVIYIDDLEVTEIKFPKVTVEDKFKLETEIQGVIEEFNQSIKVNGILNIEGVEGDKVYTIVNDEKAYLNEIGIIFRPTVLNDVSSFDYDSSLIVDNGIERIPLEIVAEGKSVKLSTSIEGIGQLYGNTKFDIALYAVFEHPTLNLVVKKYSTLQTSSIVDVYNANSEYASNTNLKAWIEGIE